MKPKMIHDIVITVKMPTESKRFFFLYVSMGYSSCKRIIGSAEVVLWHNMQFMSIFASFCLTQSQFHEIMDSVVF